MSVAFNYKVNFALRSSHCCGVLMLPLESLQRQNTHLQLRITMPYSPETLNRHVTGLSSLWSLFLVLVVHEHFLVSLGHPVLAKSSECKQCSTYPTRKEWKAYESILCRFGIHTEGAGCRHWSIPPPRLKESCGKQYSPILTVAGISVGETIIWYHLHIYVECLSCNSSLWDLVRSASICNACRRISGSNPEAHLGRKLQSVPKIGAIRGFGFMDP